MNKSFNKKYNKGITLIALIITIVILLILAGVAIVALSGENGLLHRASEARKVSDAAGEKEELEAVVKSSYDRKGDLNIDTVKTNISSSIKGATTDGAAAFPLTVTYTASGNWYEVDEDGNVTIGNKSNPPAGGATLKVGDTDLSTVSDISTMYGQVTNYKSISHPGIDWQLFYDDDDTYYVIASDYVPNVELPCNGNTGFEATDLVKSTSTTKENATYCAGFASSSSCNDGVLTTGTIYKNGSASTAITGNPLTSTYLKWATNDSYKTSTNNNICSVAYMMDTSKWSSFADGAGSGAFAIGGPTIEMFVNSYNAVDSHTTKLGTYETVDSDNSNTNGYWTKKGTGSWTKNITGLDTNGTGGNMWVRTSSTKASYYWLASPSAKADTEVLAMGFRGTLLGTSLYYDFCGFRPVVCIPKSSIQ